MKKNQKNQTILLQAEEALLYYEQNVKILSSPGLVQGYIQTFCMRQTWTKYDKKKKLVIGPTLFLLQCWVTGLLLCAVIRALS